MVQTGLDSLNNAGPHGLSEILYAVPRSMRFANSIRVS